MRALITIFIISLGSIKISTCPEPPRMNINFQYDGSIKDVMPIIKSYLEEQKYDIIHYAPESGFILTDYKLYKLNIPLLANELILELNNYQTIDHSNLTGNWLEIVAGVKVETFNNVYLGFSLRLNKLLSTQKPENFDNLYIPGFNKVTDDNTFAVSYTHLTLPTILLV